MSDDPSLFIWFANTAGFFGFSAFVAAITVFFCSWLVVFRVDSAERIGRFRRVLFVPLLLAILGDVRPFIHEVEFIRASSSRMTSAEVVSDFVQALWRPFTSALLMTILTAPSFVVLTIGKSIRRRRTSGPP